MSDVPVWIVSVYVFILGLCIGSFLNVVILISLAGEDFVHSRSKCPKCKNQLTWYMNIPVLSYFFLGGKCAFCKEHISIQYPLVELICGFCYLAGYISFGLTLKTLFVWIFLSFFILLAGTDFKETVIIDIHAYILAFVGILFSFLKLSGITVFDSVLSAIFGFLFFEILALFTRKMIGFRMFGEGDSLIAIALGAIFGFKILLLIIALSFILQCFFSIPIIALREINNKKYCVAVSYLIVLIGLLGVFFVNYFKLFNDKFYLIFALTICVILLWALKIIVHEITEKKQKVCNNDDIEKSQFYIMPFGPALIFASVVCLFFSSQVKDIVLNLLN